MADKGIIFSAPMVRALLDGTKTQTRRLITKPSALNALAVFSPAFLELPGNADIVSYAPGDRLYVREAHGFNHYEYERGRVPKVRPADLEDQYLSYRATEDDCEIRQCLRYRPSIHMPRWASRLTLTVTDVRVQRLQDISEADAIEEGIQRSPHGNGDQWLDYPAGSSAAGWLDPRDSYRSLWNSLHTEPGTRWEDNPWAVAVSFNVDHGNIDAGDSK